MDSEFYKKLFQMFVDVNAIPADCSGKSAEEIKKLEESRPLKAVSIWAGRMTRRLKIIITVIL